jgi:hypothetical protein
MDTLQAWLIQPSQRTQPAANGRPAPRNRAAGRLEQKR